MSDGVHLLVSHAACAAPACRQALRALALPHLERLLVRMQAATIEAGDENLLSTSHERVLAREFGLAAPDGCIPWAAWQLAQAGREPGDAAWAWITPCHWRVATDHVAMGHLHDLQLSPAQSQQLLAAMQPFFQQDGISLEYDTPTRWLAGGNLFRGMATASLDRVVGRVIDPWMPRSPEARALRRLQQEMQMLLYTHPVTEERTRGGLLPVNSFWASGTGALPHPRPAAAPPGLQVTHALRDAAVREDWNDWSAAWREVDAKEFARLEQALDQGEPVTLTLCGERNAQAWTGPASGAWQRRLAALFAGKRAAAALEVL